MCDWAYHMETLRKARVIERKNAAQERSRSTMKTSDEPYRNVSPQKGVTNYQSRRCKSSMGFTTSRDVGYGYNRPNYDYKDPVFEDDDPMEYPLCYMGRPFKHSGRTNTRPKTSLGYHGYQYMADEDLFRPVEVQQGTGYDRIELPPSARHANSSTQPGVYRDLKKQEKTLRDHNLVMGPMASFSEYFDPTNYNPHRSSHNHY